MKKTSVLLLIIVLVSACQSTKKSNEFTINGTVPADITGTVYLQEYKNREYTTVDSAEIIDGKFMFTGSVTQPMLYALRSGQKAQRAQLFLDNNPMTVSMNSDWEIASVNGSDNALFFAWLLPQSVEGTMKMDTLMLNNLSSPVALYFLNRGIYQYDYPELKSIRDQFSDSLANHPYTQEIDENLKNLEKVQPGQPAPDFTLKTPTGEDLSLSSLSGKYVLVDFWASWCPDCRKASPLLVEAYNKFKDKNFTILGVSIDEDSTRWTDAIAKDGLNWHQVITENGWESETPKAYAVRWVPTSFLIDPEGNIVFKSIYTQETISKAAELLK